MIAQRRKGRENVREKRDAEFSGRNIEEAISKGLSELDLNRDEVEIHIISPGSRGVLGIGAEEARVSLTYYVDVPDLPTGVGRAAVGEASAQAGAQAIAETPSKQPAGQAAPAGLTAAEDEETEVLGEALTDDEFIQVEQEAIKIVGELLKGMGISATVVPLPPQGLMAEQAGEGRPIILDIRGEDLGVLIGRRAESLMALQYMARMIVNHQLKKWLNIILDVEQYRARRERSLRQLALRMADRVAATRQAVPLEAMTPYDRRVIHLALHGHKQVTTKSIGEGENRKVVIIPIKNVDK